MSEPGKSDRWNSLLETLGVPVSESTATEPSGGEPAAESPATPTKPQPVSLLRPEKPKAAPKPKPAKPAAKSPSYWSRIAGALGLEVPSAPEAAEEPPMPRAEEPDVARADEVRPHREEPRVEEPEERLPRREHDLPPRAFER